MKQKTKESIKRQLLSLLKENYGVEEQGFMKQSTMPTTLKKKFVDIIKIIYKNVIRIL